MSEQAASGPGGHAPGLFPVPGDGGLARHRDLILLCGLEDGQAADDLLDLLEQAAAAGSDGRHFTDAVAEVLESADRADSVLAFGPAGPGVAVMVSGSAWADVTTADGTVRIEAGHPRMLLRGTVRSPVTEVRGGLSPADSGGARTDRFSRLDTGTVRAGGLSFRADGPNWQQASSRVDSAAAGARPAAAAAEQRPGVPAAGPAAGRPAAARAAQPSGEPAPPDGPPPSAPPAPAPGGAETELPAAPERPATDFRSTPSPTDPGAAQAGGLPSGGAAPGTAEDLGRQVTEPPETQPPQVRPAEAEARQAFDPAQPFEAVILLDAGAGSGFDAPVREPLARVRDMPPGSRSYVLAGPIVRGVYCKNGHFDDPEARFCAICGISMNQQTLIPGPGERPPLGVMLLDDGSVFQLDGDYVLGREPTLESSVAEGGAKPLRISDESGVVSRVHARVHLDGWRVLVTDLGSANGTRVLLAGQQPPGQEIAPQVPVVLTAGSQVDLGGRGFRYESHRGR